MLIALLLAATPLQPLRDVATDGTVVFALSEDATVSRVDPTRPAPLLTRPLEPARRVDAHHVEQPERLVRSPDGRLFVVAQSRNTGPLQGSVVELEPQTLTKRAGPWTFLVSKLPGGTAPVRGEVRLDPVTRLLVARVDDEKDGAALFTARLPAEPGEVVLRAVAALHGPMNGGSQFVVATRQEKTVVATTGSGAELVALKPDGTVDPTFGAAGVARVSEIVSLGALLPDGQGWLVTGAGAVVVTARLLGTGARDPAWGKDGLQTVRVREGWLEHNPTSALLSRGAGLVVASYEQKEAVLRSALVSLDSKGAPVVTEPIEQKAVLQLRVISILRVGQATWAAVNAPDGRLLQLQAK